MTSYDYDGFITYSENKDKKYMNKIVKIFGFLVIHV